MKGLVDYIRESMLKHIGIELRNYDYIYEKWGEYEGCYELAKYLVEKMSERNNSDELTIYNADVNDTIAGFKDVNEGIITTDDSSVPVYVLPTNEEIMIIKDTYNLVK